MDQSYQFYLFLLSTTTLFKDIKPAVDFSHDWFDAQKQCVGHGLTVEKHKSNKPYWTGIYRRLTPWINILGCYSDSIKTLQNVMKKTMIMGSVGRCQEMCYHENIYKFAVQMNTCLCIEHNVNLSPLKERLPSACNYKCEDNSNVIYSGECGGERAYNIFEFQEVNFTSTKTCLSLQCSYEDKRFIPRECSTDLAKICENWSKPDNGYASSWSTSMEQCKTSHPPYYLPGYIRLDDPHYACLFINSQSDAVWVGVARQSYTSIDRGLEIKEEQRGTFQECQMCTNDDCQFKRCTDLSTTISSIFCESISDTSQSQITGNLTTSQESFSASTFMSNHSTTEELFALTSTTGHYVTDNSLSTSDTQQMPSASDELALKISLPVITVFIILLLCAIAKVFYSRRRKMTKPDRNTNAQVESGPKKNIDLDVDYFQNNSYFVIEQCPKYISKGTDSSIESPYNNSEEGVYDHLRDKTSRKPEVEDTYQHASAGVSRCMSEYDTMANTVNKKQEEKAYYDYSHQDTNDNYACNLRTKNNLTDNPYDIAV